MSKGTEARDFNVIQANYSYVQNWSVAQIVVVIICTLVQVIFFKKMIKYFDSTPNFRSTSSKISLRIQETVMAMLDLK